MFVSDDLTTKNQVAEDDYQMIADQGFEIVISGAESEELRCEGAGCAH